MTDNEATQAQDLTNIQETSQPVVPVVRGRGRPKRTDGIENRSERFALQLQPVLRRQLKLLAEYDECSETDIITMLLENYINMRIEDINYIVHVKEELQARKAQKARL